MFYAMGCVFLHNLKQSMIHSLLEAAGYVVALMHPKDADGMANSVDPDKTASSEAV